MDDVLRDHPTSPSNTFLGVNDTGFAIYILLSHMLLISHKEIEKFCQSQLAEPPELCISTRLFPVLCLYVLQCSQQTANLLCYDFPKFSLPTTTHVIFPKFTHSNALSSN